MTTKRAFLKLLNCRGINIPGRLIYASGSGKTPGGSESNEKVTPENVEQQLTALEEAGKLTVDAVTKALKVLKSGDEKAKEKVIKLTEKVLDGTYKDSDAFETRLPKVTEATVEGEKKTAESAESKEAAPKKKIKKVSEKISEQVSMLMQNVEEVSGQVAKREEMNEEARKKMEKLSKDSAAINALYRANNEEADKQVKVHLDSLKSAGKINNDAYGKFTVLNALDEDFKKDLAELSAPLDDEKSKEAVAEITRLKKEQAEKNRKIEEDTEKLAHEFRETMHYCEEVVMEKARRDQAIEAYAKRSGLNVQPGQKLTYSGLRFDEEGLLKPTRETAIIKEVKFLAEEAPTIIIASKNAQTGEMVEEAFSPVGFERFVNAMGATEDLQSLQDLTGSIGFAVKAGDIFEYPFQKAETEIEDIAVKIEKIDEGKENGEITLDKDVKLSPSGSPVRILTYGEFARWVKGREAMKVIASMEELRDQLRIFNDVQNTIYERKPKNYPPITGEVNEILKYNDGTDRTWVIKEIDNEKVKFDNGETLTLTAFLRWVKRNKVEKFTPASEAAQATEISNDAEERAKKEAEAAKKVQDRLAEADKKPGHSNEHHSTSHDAAPSVNYFKKLWAETRFISPHGLFEMGKTIVELYKRKLKRSEHGRVGTVGEQMFGTLYPELGAEFKGVAQHAENEEVKHHADHYRTMGKGDVIHELHEAPTKDILKAAVTVLTEKGHMRWDDPEFWKAMNKYTYGQLIDEDTGKPMWVNENNYMRAIEKYMDHWWGQDTFTEFRRKQDSSYTGTRSAFEDHAKRLENDPDKNGGLKFQLKKMLWQHLNGEHVNAAQFESYLHYAIKAGKLGFADKIFFLIMAVGQPGKGAGGHAGQTLLHIDRVGALDSELMNNFPILDYFIDSDTVMLDENGNVRFEADGKTPKTGRPDINNFKHFIREYIEKDIGGPAGNVTDPKDLAPGVHLKRFIDREAVWNDNVRNRLQKSAKTAVNWDHDDMHKHAAFLTESLVEQILIKQGGATQPVSIPGLKNALAGFNDFIKLKIDMVGEHSKEGEQDKAQQDMRQLTNLLKSFVKLDGLLDERNTTLQGNFTRFSAEDWGSTALVEETHGRTVLEMTNEVRGYVGNLVRLLDAQTGGQYRLASSWREMIQKKTSKDDKDKQTETAKGFGDLLDGALSELTTRGVNVADIFSQAQNEGGKKLVQGILSESTERKEVEEKRASVFDFKPYADQVMATKIDEIKELRRKIAETPTRTAEEIKRIKNARADSILMDFDAGTYSAQPDDGSILDAEIDKLRRELQIKKSGQAPEEGGGTPTGKGPK